MAKGLNTTTLVDSLKAEGYDLPKNCKEASLFIPAFGAYELRFICFVDSEDMVKLGKALTRVGGFTD